MSVLVASGSIEAQKKEAEDVAALLLAGEGGDAMKAIDPVINGILLMGVAMGLDVVVSFAPRGSTREGSTHSNIEGMDRVAALLQQALASRPPDLLPAPGEEDECGNPRYPQVETAVQALGTACEKLGRSFVGLTELPCGCIEVLRSRNMDNARAEALLMRAAAAEYTGHGPKFWQ